MNSDEVRESIMNLIHNVRENMNEKELEEAKYGTNINDAFSDLAARVLRSNAVTLPDALKMFQRKGQSSENGLTTEKEYVGGRHHALGRQQK